jgi:hypothetical protein
MAHWGLSDQKQGKTKELRHKFGHSRLPLTWLRMIRVVTSVPRLYAFMACTMATLLSTSSLYYLLITLESLIIKIKLLVFAPH